MPGSTSVSWGGRGAFLLGDLLKLPVHGPEHPVGQGWDWMVFKVPSNLSHSVIPNAPEPQPFSCQFAVPLPCQNNSLWVMLHMDSK